MDWPEVAAEFEWDGSWRDIYVLGADVQIWTSVLERLRANDPAPEYFVDGEAAALPTSVEEVFALREHATPLLSVMVSGMRLNCHFFSPDQVELDLDPREVLGQVQLDALLAFLRELNATSGRAVVLTPENVREEPIFRVGEGGDLTFCPARCYGP